MTKCHFGLYGGSGTLQKFDALCVLGMNIINEKVSFSSRIQITWWQREISGKKNIEYHMSSSGVRLPLVLVHALGRYHRSLHYLQACYLIIQPIYDTEPFLYLCVHSHPFLMQIVNTNSFRIVPVCVPSVRKWGAYNMATIIDKFDFKFANRVTISFFLR